MLLAENTKLRDTVCRLLAEDWSPKRISGRLREIQVAGGPQMYGSHETIYKSLFIQARGVFREELKKHLRTKRMFRHARAHRVSSRRQIIGANNSAIATVVERQSRFTVLCTVKNRKASSVVSALTDQMLRLPQHLLKSLTWDRGQEVSAHKAFTLDTDMTVYFCDPSSPWQRGANENTNGLLR
jgi:IS30 family transposase